MLFRSNNGIGGFTAPPFFIPTPATGTTSLQVADINGDGVPDLLLRHESEVELLLLNPVPNTFTNGPTTSIGPLAQDIAVGDLNGDGIPDLVVANRSLTPGQNGSFTFYSGARTGIFTPETTLPTGPDPNRVILADVDGDGKADLVLQFPDGSIGVWYIGGPSGSVLTFTPQPPVKCGQYGPVDILGLTLPGATNSSILMGGCAAGLNVVAGVTDPTAVDPNLNNNAASVFFPVTPAAPVISDFSPKAGVAGTLVVISGSGLTNAQASLNGTPLTVDSSNGGAMFVTVPLGTPAGAGPITVNAFGGTVQSSALFTVLGPPVLNLPAKITVPATSPAGAVVNYTVTATDPQNSSVQIKCNPPSGATFPLGITAVNCTATDAFGLTATGSFNVSVIAGTPRILFQASAATQVSPGVFSVPVTISNTGTGTALSVDITSLGIRVLTGTGPASIASPQTPLAIGDLFVGGSKIITLTLDVAPTTKRVALTYSASLQTVIPSVGTEKVSGSTAVFLQ